MADSIYIPIAAPLLVGLLLWIIQSIRVRSRMIDGLVIEINDLLDNANMINSYLNKENHHWLKVGVTINEAPTFVIIANKFYDTYLSKFYLLTKQETEQICLFYSEVEACLHQVRILFDRIKQQCDNKSPLTQDQVDFHKLRIKKITKTFEGICRITDGKIKSISDLPKSYPKLSFGAIEKEMNKLREKTYNN